jgi:hypothetical protein
LTCYCPWSRILFNISFDDIFSTHSTFHTKFSVFTNVVQALLSLWNSHFNFKVVTSLKCIMRSTTTSSNNMFTLFPPQNKNNNFARWLSFNIIYKLLFVMHPIDWRLISCQALIITCSNFLGGVIVLKTFAMTIKNLHRVTIWLKISYFQAHQKFFMSCLRINIVVAYFRPNFMKEESLLYKSTCTLIFQHDKKNSNSKYIKIVFPREKFILSYSRINNVASDYTLHFM